MTQPRLMGVMWTSLIVSAHYLIAFAIAVRVLLHPRMEPPVRLAWVLFIIALPVIGIIGYVLFGEVRMRQAEVQKRADVRDNLTGRWQISPQIVDNPGFQVAPVVQANIALDGFYAVGGNRLHLLPEDDRAIDDLVAAIDDARDHVHVLFYIWLPDDSGARVARAVARAAARGVTVRVIVDALGSRGLVRSHLWGEMTQAGAECVTALPFGMPLVSLLFQRLDLRNHRKVVVIDNDIAFTGSRNCADMAFAVKARFGPWIDIFVQLRGPAVRQLQGVFLADWMSYTGSDLGDMLQMVDAADDPGAVVQAVATGPDRYLGSIADSLTTMLYAARERVTITTPYYIPDQALDAAIRSAARRGVQVTMILPERNDSLFVGASSQVFYHGLIESGVRLMLFQGGLLHSKIMTVDGAMAMIGSANLDRRSFDLNYEMNLLVVDRDFVAELDQRQASYIARARPIDLPEVQGWSAIRRVRNNLLALASPLL
ncbi:cardiolipin synthase [Paracoccus sp. (in: a-proteobacteria)]|uniref:cardiolipin synthase n=1 Tax=Paracoccus sp. TaxID=267 RepID=UPI0026E0ACB1|nr:cardiolipin synthase [Paracoccus sp. (in: a-proteobacteria)]MDO5647056.1 cardiolipin synthase [Paracoccus sp. (in: a-proteobacteria)]